MIYTNDYKSIDKTNWGRFVLDHKQGNIFHSPELISVFERTKYHEPVVIFAICDGEIAGVFAGVILKEYPGIAGYFTSRCIVTGGPLVRNEDTVVSGELIKEFTEAVRRKSVYIQIRNLHETKNLTSSFILNGYRFEDHLDIIIDLSGSFESLKNKIHKSRLKNASKAYKKGVIFKELSTVAEIYAGHGLVKETYKKIKLPYPDRSLFTAVAGILIPAKLCYCYGLFLAEELIGFRMVLAYGNTIYDYYAGSSGLHANKYPNDVLILEVQKMGCSEKFDKFVFGGAGRPGKHYGVRDHKLKFGGELVNYGRYVRINNPIVYYPVSGIFNIFRFIRKLF